MEIIETMKDIKSALNKVPDNVLEDFFVCGDEDSNINLTSGKGDTEEEMHKSHKENMEKYPELMELSNYFRNLVSEARREEGNCEPINSGVEE